MNHLRKRSTRVHHGQRRIGYWILGLSCAAWLSIVGCNSKLQVRTYEAPKTSRAEPPLARTVAAAIPVNKQIWFIKALDQPQRLEGLKAALIQIVRDMKVENADQPQFTLPDGWQERPGGGMSRVILSCNTVSPPVSFAVTVLEKPEKDWEKYLRDNLNRWRDQLLLVPQRLEELLSQVDKVERPQGSEPAYVVDWSGRSYILARMMAASGPMSSLAPNASANPPSSSSASPKSSPLGANLQTPPDWIAADVSPFQLARFTIGNENDPGDVVVSSAKNDLETNSFMWQNQLMPEGASDAIKSAAQQALSKGEKFPLASGEGDLYLFQDGESEEAKALLIAILPLDANQSLFVKMRGSRRLVLNSKQALLDFAKSLSQPR